MQGLSIQLAEGSPRVLHVRGEIDLATAPELRTALEEIASDPAVVVDMEDVSFIDAGGLRVILQAAERRDGAGPLRLVNAARVQWLLKIVGLEGTPSIQVRCESGGHGCR
jgi:anti-anti-sigma factor